MLQASILLATDVCDRYIFAFREPDTFRSKEMKYMHIPSCILMLALGLLSLSQNSIAGGGDVAAPVECLRTAQSLLGYLFNEKPDISQDITNQDRWLSKNLRDQLFKTKKNCAEEAKRRPNEKIEWPTNESFLMAWEKPSAYNIIGSRRYGSIVFVDVEFSWGASKNYAGNRRIQSYIFMFEHGHWKLDDVYNVREKYAEPANLVTELRALP